MSARGGIRHYTTINLAAASRTPAPASMVFVHPCVVLSGLVKSAVLREGAAEGKLGLIDSFWTGNRLAPRLTLAFVD
jgi:hypothetical protein